MNSTAIMVDGELIIGRTVRYSMKKDVYKTGLCIDKILGREKAEDTFAITKYVVEDDETGELVYLAHWRVVAILPESEESPIRHLPGGFRKR
jgi:hypothetical protein